MKTHPVYVLVPSLISVDARAPVLTQRFVRVNMARRLTRQTHTISHLELVPEKQTLEPINTFSSSFTARSWIALVSRVRRNNIDSSHDYCENWQSILSMITSRNMLVTLVTIKRARPD